MRLAAATLTVALFVFGFPTMAQTGPTLNNPHTSPCCTAITSKPKFPRWIEEQVPDKDKIDVAPYLAVFSNDFSLPARSGKPAVTGGGPTLQVAIHDAQTCKDMVSAGAGFGDPDETDRELEAQVNAPENPAPPLAKLYAALINRCLRHNHKNVFVIAAGYKIKQQVLK